MGTRGLIFVVVDGEAKGTYNHYDSYPTGLGVEVGKFAATLVGETLTEYAGKARAIKLIDEQDKPTAEDREKYGHLWDNVSTGDDWYSLLRNAQGDLKMYLDMGIMPDNLSFAADSLFCEWAYGVNLDTGTVEVYRGFQKDAAAVKGRFAKGDTEGDYAPITLLGNVTFANAGLADFWRLLEEVVYAEDEDETPPVESVFSGAITA